MAVDQVAQEFLENYLNQGLQEVEGWFFPGDVALFQILASIQQHNLIKGDLCELGVYKGKSLILLNCLRSSDQHLFAFDLFPFDTLEETKKNLVKWSGPEKVGSVDYVIGKSTEHTSSSLRKHFKNRLRFLHIDAGHEYHEVLQSLYAFAPHLSDVGVIAMDDYQDREFPGIESAVHAFSRSKEPRRFVPFLSGSNKIYLCLDKMANFYQKQLLNQPHLKDRCRVSFIDNFFVLVAFSKLPLSNEKIISILDGEGGEFSYPVDENFLKTKADNYGQFSSIYQDNPLT